MKWKHLSDQAKSYTDKALAGLAVISNEVTTGIAQTSWFKGINSYTSEISKSMDANFLKDGTNKVMTPSNHRIMDEGHDFFSTIEKAQEVGAQNNWDSFKTFEEWGKSYFTDLSSGAGMPALGGLSDEIYTFLRSMSISEANARDFVTVNGQEALEAVLGGAVASVALLFSWKKADKDAFSRALGTIIAGGILTLNPAALMVAMIALAIGYNRLVCKETIVRGAIVSTVGLTLTTVIPGPVLLGAIPGLVASIYLHKKMGKSFKPIEASLKYKEKLRLMAVRLES